MEEQSDTIQKMLMQATLMSNLATLKCYYPEIHQFYQTYKLSGNEISIDNNGKPNLLNNGEFVYDDAALFAKSQVDNFCSNTNYQNYFTFDIAPQKDSEINFEHERTLKKLDTIRKKDTFYDTPNNPWNEEQIDCMFMIGSGLGYQIEEIFKQKRVCNFFLFEPSPEVFFAMLHCIDLKPLIEHCFAKAGQFKITIGFGPETALNNLNDYLKEIGNFNIARMFVFKHYESETTEKLISLIQEIGHRLSQGFGFMEDEVIGFSHLLSNIEAGFPLLMKKEYFVNKNPNRPVLIAGNGPSLDNKIKIIKERENEFIILSCGTSLRALLANGITPDIHIEMERTSTTLPWIESIPNQEQLKNIQIIALAPVCDEVLNKFKTPKIINKLFDYGGYLVKELDKLDLYESPDKMNPTVTNCALTLMISLGFKNIYLIGTDLGFKSLEHHHSKDSMYYDEEKYSTKESLDMFKKELTLKGNFGGKVYSTKVFEQSKGNIELLLDKNKSVTAFNCSDGVAIKGTTPLEFDEIPVIKNKISKKEFLTDLLKISFSSEQLSYSEIEALALKSFGDIKSIIDKLFAITDRDIRSRDELRLLFSLQYQTLFKEIKSLTKSAGAVGLFLQGSLKYFHAVIMSNSYYYNNLDKRNIYINDAITIMKEHFYVTYQELTERYNMPSKV
ncbi:motility associated factor glycosyltransferase family protein [Cognaticolwellia mytili]|uniref:motility associated factor glycosyltransferase family protein n=1 Tax=Cognaticolwellia mytili TaxID=1888913 RepID=UPI000A177DA9|nr:6-hydroxymethylpterin diphosphokinase MptE-like protein [Cognaticolwellia mytili]